MELVFNTNNTLRKLVKIWNMFGPPDSPANRMIRYANFFGNDFYLASQINKNLNEIKNRTELWTSLLDERVENIKHEKGDQLLINQLIKLKIPMEDGNNELFSNAKASIQKDFRKYEPEINKWLKKIFNFKLPGEANLILDYVPYGKKGFSGSAISYNPIIVSLEFSEYDKSMLGVILHEMLHSLISKDKKLQKFVNKKGYEEPLLDYFSPDGILDWKIGLINTFNIEKHQRKQEESRPYAAEKSRSLLPHMKEYYDLCGKTTVWKFLQNKKT